MGFRKIVHIDMDAFYASVEQRDDPQLRGKPVIVAWRAKRSVVCAASYEARRFGVRSAMPASRAERLCPDAIFVAPDFTRYRAVSRLVREILIRHTDVVEPLSRDEAYLDVTENKTGLPTATRVASAIREQIRQELNLTASAGVAPNKFLAKLASDWRTGWSEKLSRSSCGRGGTHSSKRGSYDQRRGLLKQIVVAILCCGFLVAQTKRPERLVEGNTITSERDPKVRIQLPKSAQYVGADRWVLYGIADCELHAFVDADRQKNVQRLYWVQFEGYLPTKPELKHKYDSPQHAKISGMDFYVDTWVRANDAEIQPGSDREHIEALIRAKGYKMPARMMYVRLVHLLDEQKRKELMIIYGEDVASTGVAAAELHEGGKAYDQWPIIEKGLVERAEKIVLEETGKP